MLVNLKSSAVKAETQSFVLELSERLPAHLIAPCVVNGQFRLKTVDSYYVMELNINAILTISCQRCLNEFSYHYNNYTELAICNSDEDAEQLMERYECIVAVNNQIDLLELVTDELHLYAPEFHPELKDCNDELSRFMQLK